MQMLNERQRRSVSPSIEGALAQVGDTDLTRKIRCEFTNLLIMERGVVWSRLLFYPSLLPISLLSFLLLFVFIFRVLLEQKMVSRIVASLTSASGNGDTTRK